MLDWIRRRGRASGPTMEGLFGALEEGGFTEGALRGVALAREEAQHFGHSYVGTEHILLGILREDGGAAATVLEGSGVGLDEARASVEGVVGQDDGDPGPLEEPLTPRAKRVLRLARQEALRLDHDHVGPGHLLLGLVRDAEEGEGLGVAARVLVDLGVDRRGVRRRVQRELGIEE
jgi:ATP-dependent Clp protease ATP-binding subunit ClpC